MQIRIDALFTFVNLCQANLLYIIHFYYKHA